MVVAHPAAESRSIRAVSSAISFRFIGFFSSFAFPACRNQRGRKKLSRKLGTAENPGLSLSVPDRIVAPPQELLCANRSPGSASSSRTPSHPFRQWPCCPFVRFTVTGIARDFHPVLSVPTGTGAFDGAGAHTACMYKDIMPFPIKNRKNTYASSSENGSSLRKMIECS